MFASAKLIALGCLLGTSQAAYTLKDDFTKQNFFSSFNFFSEKDPTNGNVSYVDSSTANSQKLAGFASDEIFLGVNNQANGYVGTGPIKGRQSTRVESKKTYTKGLFIADITHMPEGCGVWPALWTFGSGWPNKGEIDILEGVNLQAANAVTLHTSSGCVMDNMPGKTALVDPNCNADEAKKGCSQPTTEANSYGSAFNAKKGGIYAMEWTSSRIAVWFFSRGSAEEQKLSAGGNAVPDPSQWPTPMANFAGAGCNIDQHFKEHNIIINTSLCGEWAGAEKVWASFEQCAKLGPCNDYVMNNPDAFTNAYWTIKSLRVYQ